MRKRPIDFGRFMSRIDNDSSPLAEGACVVLPANECTLSRTSGVHSSVPRARARLKPSLYARRQDERFAPQTPSLQ